MDIQDLIPKTIESIKVNRQVRPTVYAYFDDGSMQPYVMMHFMGDGRAKAQMLFAAGREAGRAQLNRELQETCFVTEVWLTQGQRNPMPGQRPPAHITQMEGVMFAICSNSEPFDTLVKIYQLKRDKKQKPTELKFFNENRDSEGLMGLAFIVGWRSRHMSDTEVLAQQPRGMRSFLK